MRRFSGLVIIWLMLGAAGWAQDFPRYEVFGGYSHLVADTNHTSFNLDGGAFSATQNVNNWFGGMLDVGFQYGTRNGYNVNSQQYMYGPVFSYRKMPKLAPSGYVLVGAVHGSQGFAGISQPATSIGVAFGGHVDYKLSKYVSFRVVQADYLITDFLSTHQHSIRFSTGLVFTFGNKK